jgi:hypothetical protein
VPKTTKKPAKRNPAPTKTKPAPKTVAKKPTTAPVAKPKSSKAASKPKPANGKVLGHMAISVQVSESLLISGGMPAAPQITAPPAGAQIPAGANLEVDVTTNRPDLSYIVELTDITPPPPAPFPGPIGPGGGPLPPPMPLPIPFNVTPMGNNFSVIIPGSNFVSGHTYSIRVYVDPADGATPPNADCTINVTAE